MMRYFRWLASRVGVIYILIFIFCLICVDFKMLQIRIKLRHLNDAIPDFSSLIVFDKTDSFGHVDWKPYQDYFTLILSYMPGDVIAEYLLGIVEYNMGHESQAINLLKSATTFQGGLVFWSNYDLGVIYYQHQMWAKAADYLFKAVMGNPKLTMVLMSDSVIYKQIFANPYFKYSLDNEFNDGQAHAYILLLSSLFHLGQFDKMIVLSSLAINNPHLPYKDAFYFYQGLGFLEIGQLQKAMTLFEKSIEIQKKNPEVYYYLAQIYKNAGRPQEARDLLQISYALHQQNDPRFPYDAHLKLRFF